MNYRSDLDDEQVAQVLLDWSRALSGHSDEIVRAAADVWIDNEQWMPTLAGFLLAVDDQERVERRRVVERALPSGPRNDEPIANARAWAQRIRASVAERDVLPDNVVALWSACNECDGSHFVEIDRARNMVRPCSTCNAHSHELWAGGHYLPNHRCETCAPIARRRQGEQ